MPKLLELTPARTYATHTNAVKAVHKHFGEACPNLRFMVLQTPDKRYYPVFIGQEAVTAMVHFHFCVVM